MGLAISQTKATLRDALLRFAKHDKLTAKEVQILIKPKSATDATPEYVKMHKWSPTEPKQVLTFKQILNVEFDFMGRESLAVPFLMKTFVRIAEEKKCKLQDVQIAAYTNDDKAEKIQLYLYLNFKIQHELTFGYVFEEEGLEQATAIKN